MQLPSLELASGVLPPSTPSPLQVLREVFGYQEFRPGQAQIVEQVVAGRDALVIMPTGDVNVSLTGTEKSYAFDLSAGLGEIRLNGQSKGAFDAEYETGSNGGAEVELTAGVGDIDVLTQQ
jgi:hypothetical protein